MMPVFAERKVHPSGREVWIAICMLIGLLGGPSVWAQSDENLFVGSRPFAMGGAFTAVADDANAMFYNPAGLQSLRQPGVTFMNADLFGVGIRTMYASCALPLGIRQSVGMDWQHIGFGDEEVSYNRDIVKVAFSRQLHPRFSVGAGFKYLMTNMSLDGQSVGRGTGMGLDVGLLFSPTSRFRFGVNFHDVIGTQVRYDAGGTETLLSRMIRPGVAWLVSQNLLLAVDVDRRLHLGAEYWFDDRLALRLGVQKDLEIAGPVEFDFGIGLRYRALRIDFSHAPSQRGLGKTQRYGFSAMRDPCAIRIVRIRANDLFVSHFKTYEKLPMGSILLRNTSAEPLMCRLIVSVPGYEKVAHQEILVLPKGNALQEAPLQVLLSEDVLNVLRDTRISIEAKVEYELQNRTRSNSKRSKVILYGRGVLPGDDVERMAAFVTSRDPEIAGLARAVSRQVAAVSRVRPCEEKIVQAIAIFEALRAFGIRCQSPYREVGKGDGGFRTMLYPRELLRQKVGDREGCAVLYCALLESLGIHTGLVDIPGHTFAAFDMGADTSQVHLLGIPEDSCLGFRGRLWMPVDTALWEKPFGEAWRGGIAKLKNTPYWQERIRPVADAWLTYPPAHPPFEFTVDDSPVRLAYDRQAAIHSVEILEGVKRDFVARK